MSLLPLQGASEGRPWSLARDTQLRSQLEAGLGAVLPPGFLPGFGTVTQSGPNEITLASGSVVWTAGVTYTLPAALLRSGFADGTNYVWGLLARVPADQAVKTALDTYAFTLSHVLNDPTPPSALHIPVAVLTVASGAITAAAEPLGKWARVNLTATATWDPPSLADGAVASTTLTVTGAAVGDPVVASLSTMGANNVLLTAHVQAANTVRCVLRNVSGGVLDLASGTLKATVLKF